MTVQEKKNLLKSIFDESFKTLLDTFTDPSAMHELNLEAKAVGIQSTADEMFIHILREVQELANRILEGGEIKKQDIDNIPTLLIFIEKYGFSRGINIMEDEEMPLLGDQLLEISWDILQFKSKIVEQLIHPL